MGVLIFGAGNTYQKYKHFIDGDKILAFIDNSSYKQGKIIDGKTVLSVKDGLKLNYEYIYIMSVFYDEMYEELVSCGVPETKILGIHNLDKIVWKNSEHIRINNEMCHKRVIAFSHNLSLSGAPWALYGLMKILKSHGYNVQVASSTDGELRKYYERENIKVIIDEKIDVVSLDGLDWIQSANLIIVNTFLLYYLLERDNSDIPVLWWIHEPEDLYKNVCGLHNINLDRVSVYAVSKVAEDAFHKVLPQINVQGLVGGIKDCGYIVQAEHREQILTILDIGTINKIKGQDILINAVKSLGNQITNRIKVYLIGEYDKQSNFFNNQIKGVIDAAYLSKTIMYVGNYNYEQMQMAYQNADIVVVPSRQETLSLVAIEAMMYGKICIVSDACGICEYIRDRENGIVFESENPDQLKQVILWVINNPDKVKEIRKNARETFLQYFNITIFEKKVMSVIDQTESSSQI